MTAALFVKKAMKIVLMAVYLPDGSIKELSTKVVASRKGGVS